MVGTFPWYVVRDIFLCTREVNSLCICDRVFLFNKLCVKMFLSWSILVGAFEIVTAMRTLVGSLARCVKLSELCLCFSLGCLGQFLRYREIVLILCGFS